MAVAVQETAEVGGAKGTKRWGDTICVTEVTHVSGRRAGYVETVRTMNGDLRYHALYLGERDMVMCGQYHMDPNSAAREVVHKSLRARVLYGH